MKYWFNLYFLLIFFSCVNKNNPNAFVVPHTEPFTEGQYVYYPIKDNRIKVDLNKPQTASLFDYFSHIELIPLETNDKVLIGWIEEITYNKGRYYVFDRQQHRIYVFDDSGKFMFQINKRGQGPGEYITIRSIYLNPFTGNIDLADFGYICSYNLSGNFVKKIHPPSDLPFYDNLLALNEKTYVFYLGTRGKVGPYKIIYYDVENNEIIRKEYEEDSSINNFYFINYNSHTPFYEYQGKWYFCYFADNITYEVGQDSLIKAYTWDFGKYNYNLKTLNLPNDPSCISLLPYQLYLQGQNNRYLVTWVLFSNHGYYLIYDKSTDECKSFEHFTEVSDFTPRKVTNEYVLSWCSHGDLKKYIFEEMLDENNRQKLKNLINAKDEMNPVIIKYYFK